MEEQPKTPVFSSDQIASSKSRSQTDPFIHITGKQKDTGKKWYRQPLNLVLLATTILLAVGIAALLVQVINVRQNSDISEEIPAGTGETDAPDLEFEEVLLSYTDAVETMEKILEMDVPDPYGTMNRFVDQQISLSGDTEYIVSIELVRSSYLIEGGYEEQAVKYLNALFRYEITTMHKYLIFNTLSRAYTSLGDTEKAEEYEQKAAEAHEAAGGF